MDFTDVAIIGAGQAGLAMSRRLAAHAIDHVVFERGEVGERWRTGTWDSLRLLTPNWMNGLPSQPYAGGDPDGFMTRDEFLSFLGDYASGAPLLTRTDVHSVDALAGRYQIRTSRGLWLARAVVVATGHCDTPCIPASAHPLHPSVASIHSSQYRSPQALGPGDVLVVGASSSGVQIADELRRAGRNVTLSVGRHTRLPRTWRGEDIFRWLDRTGLLRQRAWEVPDLEAAKRQPSLQLVGRPDRSTIDLVSLHEGGVRMAGRVATVDGGHLAFAADLEATVAAADAKLRRILAEIDAFAGGRLPPLPIRTLDAAAFPGPSQIRLGSGGVRTVVWATGYRRAFPWLNLPVLSADGEIEHEGGVTAMPGLYALGFRFLRKRDSNFIGGVGDDAVALSSHIAAFLRSGGRRAA